MIAKRNASSFSKIMFAVLCVAVLAIVGIMCFTYPALVQNSETAGIQIDKFDIGRASVTPSPLYTVSNDSSSVEYGTYKALEHNPTLAASNGEVTGIKVSLSQGDVLQYNKVIDLTEYTKEMQLISFCITPDTIGIEDVGAFEVILTDAYDSSNKVTVNVKNSPDGVQYANSYIKGKAEGQQLTGWEWNYGKKHVANAYGYPVRLSFSGLLNNPALVTIADNSFNLSFDYAERELHSTIRQASGTSTVICDLDNGDDFSTLWRGFTTGECFVSIRATDYAKDKANFVITKIADQDMRELTFTDRGIPRVKVNISGYKEDQLPVAVKGLAYPLFPASCVSPYYGELEVKTHVVYNQNGSDEQEVPVTNNAFVPTTIGQYTVIYEAKDPQGTVGTAMLTVTAVAATDEIIIDGDGLYPSECFAGELVDVVAPHVAGGSGNLTVKKIVDFNGNVTELSENSFRPTVAGKYKLIFRVTDYCGQYKIYRHELSVAAGNKPVFTQDAVLPHYFVSGAEYLLPALNAQNYTDGSGREVSSKITVTDENGTKNVRGNKIKPTVKKNGEIVTVTYTASIEGKSSNSISYEIPTVIVKDVEGYVSLDKLLYSPDASVTSIVPDENGTVVTAAKEGAMVDFINPLPAHGFEFEFRIPSGGANFDELTIYLTDAENPMQKCAFTYRKATTYSTFTAGDETNSDRATQKFGSQDTFRLSYNALRNEISFDPESKRTVTPIRTVSGDLFNGFSSGMVYLSLQFKDIVNTSQVTVVSVDGQLINDDTIDFVAPKVAVLGDAGGTRNQGATVILPKAVAGDGVDYLLEFGVTVLDPQGKTVTATDGTLLENAYCGKEYSIVLNKIGAYSVRYKAKDASDNQTDIGSYVLQVVDVEKPVITVSGNVPSTGKVGTQIIVPSASVADNITEDIAVKIYLITAKGQVLELKDRAFTPKSAGKYIVRYWCVDAAGNMQVVDYTITIA